VDFSVVERTPREERIGSEVWLRLTFGRGLPAACHEQEVDGAFHESRAGGFYQRSLFAALDCLIGFGVGFWRASAFCTGSGGGEGAMPRRCVSGTAIV
jgi:hypothetical protein